MHKIKDMKTLFESIKELFPKNKKNDAIDVWKINRNFVDNPIKSSIKLIIPKGKANKNKNFLFNKNIKIDKDKKTMPPALGLGK